MISKTNARAEARGYPFQVTMVLFETFDHEADVGIRGYGKTLEEAFEHGAEALFSLMVDLSAVRPAVREKIVCEAPDPELLFVEWLNSLLSLAHLEGMVFCKFKTEIVGQTLHGKAWGERLDRKRHRPETEVKAATYCMLKVKQEGGLYTAQCVVDV